MHEYENGKKLEIMKQLKHLKAPQKTNICRLKSMLLENSTKKWNEKSVIAWWFIDESSKKDIAINECNFTWLKKKLKTELKLIHGLRKTFVMTRLKIIFYTYN